MKNSNSISSKGSTNITGGQANAKGKTKGKQGNKGRSNVIRNEADSTTHNDNDDDTNNDGMIKVAIIGGGIAGLSCAAHLTNHHNPSSKCIPTVFDTGRLRPGGRCSSRMPDDRPPKGKNRANQDGILSRFVVDHAAQILTVPGGVSGADGDGGFDAFRDQVEEWERQGVVRKFPPRSVVDILPAREMKQKQVGDKKGNGSGVQQDSGFKLKALNNLDSDDKKSSNRDKTNSSPSMYYGVNGMGSLPTAITYPSNQQNNNEKKKTSQPLFQIEQDTWISPNNGVKFIGSTNNPKWSVQTNGKKYGSFDRVIIAHNGKCADRLMSKTPAKALHSTLRTNFSPTVPAGGGQRMTLNSIYSLTVALRKDTSPISPILGDGVVAAFVRNEPSLKFVTCQTRKHGSSTAGGRRGGGGGDDDNIEVWTILSSAQFGKKYKAPQENIPAETVLQVENLMLASLERSLSLKEGTIDRKLILDSRLQLWGAGVPLNTWSSTTTTAAASAAGEKGQVKDTAGIPAAVATGFLYDAENGVGVCGDWLLDPSIGGAWESGRRVANWINQSGDVQSSGLPPNGSFSASRAAADSSIGNVR